MLLVGQAPLLRKEALERLHASLPSIQSAVATIFSLGIISSIVFVGCFRLDENHQYVLRPPEEAFLFVETVNAFFNFFN